MIKWLLILTFTNATTGEELILDIYDNNDPDWFYSEPDCKDSGSNQAMFIERMNGYTIYAKVDCVPEVVA